MRPCALIFAAASGAASRVLRWPSPIVINGVSLLETELGNRQANHLMLVHFHAPPGQEIERRHGPRNPGAKVGPYPMADFLAMENRGEHREHRFYQHPG